MADAIARLSSALADRYRIERRLGEGGMATVYLAEDLKHDRKVALKILRPELAAVLGAERFVQEIKTTANLQHPHILPLFDSGEADGFLYYVMPFVEGETLRDKLDAETQLGIDDAVRITCDVAGALDYAHRRNVIHRDIKPENILLHDGRPMVADFGIALAVSAAAGGRMTETGLSLGTPHYMSPEQATADKDITARSDVYSLASVLYEMLAGEPPHLGNSAQQIIMKIVTDTARPVTELRKSVPPHVAAALSKGLEKLAADRFESVKAFAEALGNVGFTHGTTTHEAVKAGVATWRRAAFALAATTAVLAAGLVWSATRPAPPAPTLRLSVNLPEPRHPGPSILGTLALSPDGSFMVYEGAPAGGRSGSPTNPTLMVRRWDELHATPLDGSEGGLFPSISPSGDAVAFIRAGAFPRDLQIVPIEGGVPRTVSGAAGCCPRWGRDGFIYFTDNDGGISRVPEGGGARQVMARADSATETGMNAPFVLEAEGAAVYSTFSDERFVVRSVDFESGERRTLAAGAAPRVTETGHLVYVEPGRQLMVAPFDRRRLETTGPAQPAATDLEYQNQFAPFDVSRTGTLVYATRSAGFEYQVVSVNRAGAVTVPDPDWTFDPGSNNRGMALSPSGDRLAITIMGDAAEDIWVKDLPDGPLTRVTSDAASDTRPRWTPDGRSVTYVSNRVDGRYAVFRRAADGTGPDELLFRMGGSVHEALISPDGVWLVGRTGGAGVPSSLPNAPSVTASGGRDLIGLRLDTDSVATRLFPTPFDEKAVSLSPNGRWLAYESDETGRDEVYVRSFPDVDRSRVLVSSDGGIQPVWSRSGRELFYVSSRRELVAARIGTEAGFAVLDRSVLFDIGPEFLIDWVDQYAMYDVTPDDQGFLLMRRAETIEPELILVPNWFGELRERAGGR